MEHRKLVVVTAGLSMPSSTRLLADRLAAAAAAALHDAGVETDIEVIELRDHAHDLTNNLLTGFASDSLRQALTSAAQADGMIAVTPVFSASYSGLFKMFFDVLEADALAGTPVLIAATAGTPRHSLALDHAVRPLLAYLKAVVVPTGVFAASEDWAASGGGMVQSLADRITRAATELAALVAARAPQRIADPYADVTSFEQLLAG